MKEGRKLEYQEKTPDDKLQKMPHTKSPEIQAPTETQTRTKHWWQARNADMLPITACVCETGR